MSEKPTFPDCDQVLNMEANSLTMALIHISGKPKMLFLEMIFPNRLHAVFLAVTLPLI
jgi:hypothetical protein